MLPLVHTTPVVVDEILCKYAQSVFDGFFSFLSFHTQNNTLIFFLCTSHTLPISYTGGGGSAALTTIRVRAFRKSPICHFRIVLLYERGNNNERGQKASTG